MKDLISIIVPIYNVERYLDKCIQSIINQTYSKLEIILIDDGSPDDCPQLCDEWAKKDSRIKVVHKKNGGLSSARNSGLDIFTGKYVAFVDSDDWIDEKYIETLYKNLIKHNVDISMVSYNRHETDNIFNPYSGVDSRVITKDEAIKDFCYFRKNLAGGTWDKLCKAELFKTLRFPVGLNSEDRYTNAVIYSKSNSIYYDNTPLYSYRIRENSICTAKFNSHFFDEEKVAELAIKYLQKNNYANDNDLHNFRMSVCRNILYKLSVMNADKKYIKEYLKKTRSYYWKTISNKEVGLNFKVKLTMLCMSPKIYVKMQKGVKN